MQLPHDYLERVYAGVLGKLIGVYLGRPFEGWSYERIMAELGEITYYVHEKRNVPLIVTDDDISGTFTFLRALEDYGYRRDLSPVQIGQTWLNYIIEERTILWWGGLGNSTEHTAFLRLKQGVPAPLSGSIAHNGKIIAEQIGAQIFIDGWAMVAPGDPEFAADLAGRAASVSHDGEAIYGAQVIAAMEALAFVESDLNKLLDTALSLIPRDSVISRMINDIRAWHVKQPDWRAARSLLAQHYGYDRYPGNCHMVPNHGLIILSLLYGEDDFQRTQMIVNTSGWDTDCNAGNVGCLLGIKNGLAGLESGPDWRGPIADRLYLPTADGGRAISDAVNESYKIVNTARALNNLPPLQPKNNARFHFELPGSVQGFVVDESSEARGTLSLESVEGHSRLGQRALALHYHNLATGRAARASTATFTPPEALTMPGYSLVASPTLYPGQTVRALISADPQNQQDVDCRLFLSAYLDASDLPQRVYGPNLMLTAGMEHEFSWRIPDLGGAPIANIGVEINAKQRANGTLYLDYLTWDDRPNLVLQRPAKGGTVWRKAWVNAVDRFDAHWSQAFCIAQNRGTGLLIHGTREWRDYTVTSSVSSDLSHRFGIAGHVQGLQRYYALLLVAGGQLQLVRALDGETVLAEADLAWELGQRYELSLQFDGDQIRAWVDGQLFFEIRDEPLTLTSGAVAFICTEGRMASEQIQIQAL